jgi:Protein of unknown function (DUF2948)
VSAPLYQGLRLKAETAKDLGVFSSLLQDAVLRVADMAYQPKHHRFALVANRFRWEGELSGKRRPANAPEGERVRTALRFEGALRVRARNIPFKIQKQVLELLALEVKAARSGFRVTMTFAGNAAVELACEVIEAYLDDLTAPWPARKRPLHALD